MDGAVIGAIGAGFAGIMAFAAGGGCLLAIRRNGEESGKLIQKVEDIQRRISDCPILKANGIKWGAFMEKVTELPTGTELGRLAEKVGGMEKRFDDFIASYPGRETEE